MGEKMRLDRLLSNMGKGSRREVAGLLRSGCVQVDGRVEKSPSRQVDVAAKRVFCAGQEVRYQKYVYLVMNKPAGFVSSTDDPRERTVLELLPPLYAGRGLFPAGRLDKDTVGLLLLTNDGNFAHDMLAPKKHVGKTYFARVKGEVTEADRAAFSAGVVLDDGYRTMPAGLAILEAGEVCQVEITIREGKFHQVKRMFEAVGKRVVYLKRIKMGGFELPPLLKEGEVLEIGEKEIKGAVFSDQNQEKIREESD